MARVTGIGGIFFTAQDPQALCAWYRQHLGMDVQPWGGTAFSWADAQGQPTTGTTIWSVGRGEDATPDAAPATPATATTPGGFGPRRAPFMVNYRVDDLATLLQALREAGCQVLDKTDDSEFGRFGWVIDPEGNKVELWQPPPGR